MNGLNLLSDVYYQTETGIIKLNSLAFRVVRYEESMEEEVVTVNDITRAVIEDAINNHKQYLNDDGGISEN